MVKQSESLGELQSRVIIFCLVLHYKWPFSPRHLNDCSYKNMNVALTWVVRAIMLSATQKQQSALNIKNQKQKQQENTFLNLEPPITGSVNGTRLWL